MALSATMAPLYALHGEREGETSPLSVCSARPTGKVIYTHPPHTPAGSTPAGVTSHHSTPQALLPAPYHE